MKQNYWGKRKLYALLFCLLSATTATHSATDTPSFQSLSLLKLPKLSESPVSYSSHGHAFSHDSRLFAVFLPGKVDEKDFEQYTGGSITVWDTQTGKVKYRTVVPRYFTTYPEWEALDIQFSPDDKMILSSRGMRSDLLTWKFTESNQARIACRVGGRNEISEVLQLSSDNEVLFAQGVDFITLCEQEGEMKIPYPFHNRFSWPFGTRVLHNKQMLVLQNVYLEKSAPKDSFEEKDKSKLSQLSKEQRRHFALWDLNYYSKANGLIKSVDTENQRYIVFEAFDNQVAINQWDYANREWLEKQFFKDLQVEPIDNGSGYWRPLVKFTDDYVLLHTKSRLTLFERKGHELSLLWSKHTPMLSDDNDPYFSQNRRYVVLNNHGMIDIQTGKLTNRKPFPTLERTTLIEPVAAKRVKDSYSHGDRRYCPPKSKTQLYNLVTDEVIKEIEGTVIDMSPDGHALAVCKDKELFLLRR